MKYIFILFLGLIIIPFSLCGSDLTWSSLKKEKKGHVIIYYEGTEPFLIESKDGSLKGLEYEMMIGFKYYLFNEYGIKLDYEWTKKESFSDVFEVIKNEKGTSSFGLDIISRTREREQVVGFSQPYFPDIQVLVSDLSVPTITTIEEFTDSFDSYTAVSVKGTTNDYELSKLRSEYSMTFNTQYQQSSNDIISGITKEKGRFGYLDLPNYLIALNENKGIKRQHILPIKGIGYAVIFPLGTDWGIPLNEYFSSPAYEILKNKGIEKYLGQDVNELIQSISHGNDEELVLLLKEKEWVDQELSEREKKIQAQSYLTNMLMAGIIVILIIALALFNRNRLKSSVNEMLTRQRGVIEDKNKELSSQNEELLSMNEEKNNFINILSHDLRAPINNINGLAGVLKWDDNLTENQLKMIDHITAESRRLNKMVTRILDVEKIESKTPEDFRKIELEHVLKNVMDNYAQQAEDKNIRIKLITAPNQFVMGLEQFLFHVFENLLSNAIKFSSMGEEVIITLQSDEKHHSISFKDAGPGLTEEDQKNMFKKFTVLSAKATAGERSTGLGLSIVHKYTGLLNGELICNSEPNEGATFTVKLNAV